MIEVELGDLKRVGEDIAQVLGQRLKAEVAVKGKVLVVPDSINDKHLGVKDIKLQLKHVLHQLRLSEEYRVLAEHHRIRIVKIQEKAKVTQAKGTAAAPSRTLPYFFP